MVCSPALNSLINPLTCINGTSAAVVGLGSLVFIYDTAYINTAYIIALIKSGHLLTDKIDANFLRLSVKTLYHLFLCRLGLFLDLLRLVSLHPLHLNHLKSVR